MQTDKMTILVTGVAGFIASRVAELLLENGHTVVGVDNMNDAYDVRLKQWRLSQLANSPNFTFYQIDIANRAALERTAFQQHQLDAVINLAARAGVRQSVETPHIYVDTNVTGTLNLLELCRATHVQKFVLASTSSLYGSNNPRPFHEDANTDRPLSPYAASKKAAESLCYTYHYLYAIDMTILRYFTVYGPGGRPDMSMFRFAQWISEGQPVKIFGDGQQSRDFTYIDDIAKGTIAALRPVGYEVINLGSDTPVVLMDVVHVFEKLLEKKALLEYEPRHSADMLATWANIEKAKRLLGWRPNVYLEEGVARLLAWYQEHHAWTSQIKT